MRVRHTIASLDRRKLRVWLALFFIAMALPAGLLIKHAWDQLKWEAYYQSRLQAEELTRRVDRRLSSLVTMENNRSFSDYAYLLYAAQDKASFLQRSQLAELSLGASVPGLIGHFQVDARGRFSSPLLPPTGNDISKYGLSADEYQQRLAVVGRLHRILGSNQLVSLAPEKSDTVRDDTSNADMAPVESAPRFEHREGNVSGAQSADDSQVSSTLRQDKKTEQLNLTYAGSAAAPMSASGIEQQVSVQSAFDRLNMQSLPQGQQARTQGPYDKTAGNLGKVAELKLDERFERQAIEEIEMAPPVARKVASAVEQHTGGTRVQVERLVMPAPDAAAPDLSTDHPGIINFGDYRINTFESEIDALEFSLLGSGHLVLFRKVWRDGERSVQGLLLEQQAFFKGIVQTMFRESSVAHMSNLVVAYQEEIYAVFTGDGSGSYPADLTGLKGTLLYQSRLSAPFSGLQLIFSINHLPPGPGSSVVAWLSGILLLVLLGGVALMYRLGGIQIDLARQQQDFVSAVSHELKTPLTSIRMYGEMLKEGWVDENRQADYFGYIHDESERLSRLIENVLQLARMTRNELSVDLHPVTIAELMDTVSSRITSQVDRAGFRLNLYTDAEMEPCCVSVDIDLFLQILINLVDNAIKFSATADERVIDVSCAAEINSAVRFSVRDYGPGVEKSQMKKIFSLFYRSENELTRETTGTGIGLALVRELAQLMNGRVDVANKEPGAVFSLIFPLA